MRGNGRQAETHEAEMEKDVRAQAALFPGVDQNYSAGAHHTAVIEKERGNVVKKRMQIQIYIFSGRPVLLVAALFTAWMV